MADTEYAQGQLHLIVSYRPLGLVRATARRLESESITIDTGCIMLPEGADVEVTLSYPGLEGSQIERVSARVAGSVPGETRLALDHDSRPAVGRLLASGLGSSRPVRRPGWTPAPARA